MGTSYTSIEKQFLLDAKKYTERANKYLIEKKYGHCAGCLAKAAKKLTNAQHLGYLSSDAGLDEVMRTMLNHFEKQISDAILKG